MFVSFNLADLDNIAKQRQDSEGCQHHHQNNSEWHVVQVLHQLLVGGPFSALEAGVPSHGTTRGVPVDYAVPAGSLHLLHELYCSVEHGFLPPAHLR